jgi:hypothetical protein
MNPMMNPMVAALLGRQQGMQQPGMQRPGMPMQGQAPMGAPVTVPGQEPPLTLAALNAMDKSKLPQDWINKLSQEERGSIMPQWSNG